MSRQLNESGTTPAAAGMIPAETPTSYALSSPVGSTLARALSPTEVSFLRQRTGHTEADRPFLLWCLAGLIMATVMCGAIAMSAIVMIAPAVN